MTARTLRQLIARNGLLPIEAARALGIGKQHMSDLLAGNKEIQPELAEAARALVGKEA